MTAPDHQQPRRRRGRSAAATCALLVLASCDTGDGKTLQEPAVAFTTTVPPPVTLLSVPIETNELLTVPLDGLSQTSTLPPAPQAFQVFVPWQDGAPIPTRYTCDGEDLAPAISWTPPPAGTSELAIALIDESATDGDGPFVHWVVVGIDVNERSLFEGDLPPGAVQATNSFGSIGYGGPCPPPDEVPHVYRLTVYALNQQSELADGTPASNLLGFVEDVAIGAASLTGTALR